MGSFVFLRHFFIENEKDGCYNNCMRIEEKKLFFNNTILLTGGGCF